MYAIDLYVDKDSGGINGYILFEPEGLPRPGDLSDYPETQFVADANLGALTEWVLERGFGPFDGHYVETEISAAHAFELKTRWHNPSTQYELR